MLASYRVFWVPLIALFFSAVLNGSITLQLRTQLHSSLGGILTGVMVLFVLLFGDARKLGLGRQTKERDGGTPEVTQQGMEPFGPDVPAGD